MPRTILMTGANNGIGLAMTKTLLEMDDHVAALDLSLENLPLSPNPSMKLKAGLLPFHRDMAQPEQVQFAWRNRPTMGRN